MAASFRSQSYSTHPARQLGAGTVADIVLVTERDCADDNLAAAALTTQLAKQATYATASEKLACTFLYLVYFLSIVIK